MNPNADIRVQSLDAAYFENRLHFSHIDIPNSQGSTNLNYKTTATVRLSSTGTEALKFEGATLTGPFTLANPNQLNGLVLQPGQFVDVVVQFNRAAFAERINNTSSVFTGELRVSTDDLENPTTVVELAGNWQRRDESSWEPNINEIWETFGFGNRIPGLPFVDSQPSPLSQGGVYQAYNQYEVLSPYWKIADGFTEARVTHIAQYAGRGSAELGIHRPFQKGVEAVQLTVTAGGSQRLLPIAATDGSSFVGAGGTLIGPYSSATFTRETIPDLWQGSDVFGIHLENYSTDPFLNQIGNAPPNPPEGAVLGQWMRIFQALDENGDVIPNVYLGVQDFYGSNGDYNDNLLVIEGVAPASMAPVNAAPAAVSVQENGVRAFTGANLISVSDPDGAEMTPQMTVRLNVANGVLDIGTPGGAVVTGDGTGAVKVVGTIAQVNAALASLSYAPNAGFDGEDALIIASLDGALTGRSEVDITVTPVGGGTPPQVVSADGANVTAAGGATTTVTVVYGDDVAVNAATIDAGDITVTGPGGGLQTVTGVSVSPGGNGTPRTATYTVAARGGTWDSGDNGTYVVALKPNEVRDTSGNAAAGDTTLADFVVSVPGGGVTTRVEAESMARTGFLVNTFGGASGGSIIRAGGAGEQRATHAFAGPDGVYDLRLFYWDENDGAAQLSILVNGVEVDDFVWNQQLGSANATTATKTSRLTAGVELETGDQVVLAGFQNGSEPLRIDALDFIPAATSSPPQVASATGTNVTAAGGASTAVTVVYQDDSAIDVSSIGVGDIAVTGPGGGLQTVTGVSVSPAGNGTPRMVTYTVAARGGTWDSSDNGTYSVALKANEVRDASGAFVAANPALVNYGVAISPGPIRVEAESMALTGFVVNAFAGGSGGSIIRAGGAGEQRASYAFAGPDGAYDLSLFYWDENDGAAQLSILVNGVEVDDFVWNQQLGSPNATTGTRANHLTPDVVLSAGDQIVLSGVQNGGEPLRIDALDFIFQDDVFV